MHLNRPITTVPMVSICPRWADPRHSRWGRGYLPVEGRFMQSNLKWTDDAIIQHLRDVSCGKPFIKTTDVTNYLRKRSYVDLALSHRLANRPVLFRTRE
jgi:hypothetical protein